MESLMSTTTRPDITWFHSFDLENGEKIKGIRPLHILTKEADAILADSVRDKSVLDIGAWDGFFSFEAERRGAARVVATDHFCWSGEGWGTRQGFDYVHAQRRSRVESIDVDVNDLPKIGIGQFDTVLFLGVFYHLKDPYAGLEAAAKMCTEHLVVETVTALHGETLPAMRLFPPGELDGDPTNFWAPNLPALQVMLTNFGFKRIDFVASPVSEKHPLRKRGLRKPPSKAVHRTIAHAWR
jgi:tRNA (mo5U34)-methyltransferase